MVGSFYTRTLPYYAPRGPSVRRLLAGILRAASHSLAQLSRALSASERARTRGEQVYEFYAEAGAPEGALYVDGKLIGYVPGVTRL
ncbi:MAG: hypothetical protein IPG23_17695 [Burkholderiales bacterium]|jgi:hypothetical protein|nr:hypothetical protein [Burkholderiales bacterium]